MSARSPLRALAWKEARELWLLVAGGLAGLVLLTLAVSGANPQGWVFILVVFVAPGCAAVLGGASIASENASGARHFLIARAVGERTILLVKLAAHAIGALLLSGMALAMAAYLGLGEQGWCTPLQTTSARAWMLGLGLVPAMFLLGVAISLLLPDALSAAPAAVVGGAIYALVIIRPAMLLAGSADTAFARLPFLIAALASGVIAIVLGIADRKGLLAREGASAGTPHRVLPLALGAVFGACLIWALTGEGAQSRTVLAGSGSVLHGEIVSGARGGAVAFVASPESGRARTVISLVDDRRVVSLSVLAPGTLPIGWSEAQDAFVVEWPDGARRLVARDGNIRPMAEPVADLAVGPGPFLARAGKLVRVDVESGKEVIMFPRQEVKP